MERKQNDQKCNIYLLSNKPGTHPQRYERKSKPRISILFLKIMLQEEILVQIRIVRGLKLN